MKDKLEEPTPTRMEQAGWLVSCGWWWC